MKDETPLKPPAKELPLRHAVATLAYRASKAVRDAPTDFGGFQPGPESRSAGEVLAHMGDLMEWALSQAKGPEAWNQRAPGGWNEDCDRFFGALAAFDEYLVSPGQLEATAERIFQGAIADALTHVGQIAMMRRLAGSRVRAENYSVAKIAAGQAGLEQPAPVREFGT
jgi:hypothetical protein